MFRGGDVMELLDQSRQLWREHDQVARVVRGHVCMCDAGGHQYRRSWPGDLDSIREAELDLTVDDMPRLVVFVMDVKLGWSAALPLGDAEHTAHRVERPLV